MRICTIIARNYLAQARLLAESYATHNGGAPTSVLVIDDPEGTLQAAGEPFELVRPSQLDIDRFDGMAAMYETIELATAVKPWFMRYLLERESAPVAYLDPDIRFFADIDEVAGLLERHDAVLTPHVALEPVPRDGKQPSEIDLLASGTYNLGFIGLAPGEPTNRLLDWWSERLRYDCVVDHPMGLFVDQRWFDLVQSVVPNLAVLRDPGVNVAYWNLHERTLDRVGANYTVNGERLRFFHFSGFDPRKPHALSKHQTRTRLSHEPILAQLCDAYADALRERGFTEARSLHSPYGRLADGTELSPLLRRMYAEGERRRAFRFSPFTKAGTAEFLDWLREPADIGARHGLTRVCSELYGRRADLPRAYPDLEGEDGPGFLGWVQAYGVHDFGLPVELLPAAPPTPLEAEDPWGVNVAGYLRSELGIGEAARMVIGALDAAGIPAMPIQSRSVPGSRQGHEYAFLDPASSPFPINVICVNADGVPAFLKEAGESFTEDRHNAGFWWWEVSTFPDEWSGSFDLLDEVWVATQHVADAIEPVSPIPVVKVRIPVTVPSTPGYTRAELGLPEGFLFLFLFDYHSVFGRKNPLAVVDAFASAFPPGSGPRLALKSINHESDLDNHDRLKLAAERHPDVMVLDRYVSAAEKNAMIAACDCYVSLHRSEGFGFTPAEAMYMGKPVIATGYSGNLDFMTPANSFLVNHTMVSIGEGHWPYPAHGEWAEPDVEHAARLMRQVLDDPAAARQVGARAAADLRRTHSLLAAGESMGNRLASIRGRVSATRRRSTDRAQPPSRLDVSAVEALIRGGPSQTAAHRDARGVREPVLRLVRPLTSHEREVDEALLSAVREQDARWKEWAEAMTDRLRSAELRRGADSAALLAAIRRNESALREAAAQVDELRAMLEAKDSKRAARSSRGRGDGAPASVARSATD